MLKANVIVVRTLVLVFYWVLFYSCKEANQVAPSFIPHPNDGSKKVEYYLKKPKGTGPWPVIIFLHGHQIGLKPGGRDFVDWGVLEQFANRGFVVAAISQPGYGASDGPADYCGAFTQNAVIAVMEQLENEGIVQPHQIILEGISRGAVVAGLVAVKKATIKGIILISGVFDFVKYKEEAQTQAPKKAILTAITAEIGHSEDSLKSRSVLNFAKKIQANTLILNGENDEKTAPKQAQKLVDEINRYGGNASLVIFKNTGHHIPIKDRNKVIDPFIFNLIPSK